MKRHVVRIVLALAFITLAAEGARADLVLSSKALRALFPGSFAGTAHGIVSIQLTASRNGALRGTIMGRSDRGRWKIARGQLCISLADMTDGQFVCSYVQSRGQLYIANHGGPIVLRKLGDG